MEPDGLDFTVAREHLTREIRKTIAEYRDNLEPTNSNFGFAICVGVEALYVLIPLIVLIPLLTVSIIAASNEYTVSVTSYLHEHIIGCAIMVIVIILITMVNFFLLCRRKWMENNELTLEVENMLENYVLNLSVSQLVTPDPISKGVDQLIQSGHPYVSICTVFRNHQWQRIPALLLCERDVIALMSGDVAPGNVVELVHCNKQSVYVSPEATHSGSMYSAGTSPMMSTGWMRGMILASGDKVLSVSGIQITRNGVNVGEGESVESRGQAENSKPLLETLQNPYEQQESSADLSTNKFRAIYADCSTGSQAREGFDKPVLSRNESKTTSMGSVSHTFHRSLPNNSPELLTLTGDVKVFEMLETPIVNFIRSILQQQHSEVDGVLPAGSKHHVSKASKLPHIVNARRDILQFLFPFIFGKLRILSSEEPLKDEASWGVQIAWLLQRSLRSQLPGAAYTDSTSIISLIFLRILLESVRMSVYLIIAVITVSIVRFVIVPDARNYWIFTILHPFINVLWFCCPISLSIMIFLVECIGTANVLSVNDMSFLIQEQKAFLHSKELKESRNTDTDNTGRSAAAEVKVEPAEPLLRQPTLDHLYETEFSYSNIESDVIEQEETEHEDWTHWRRRICCSCNFEWFWRSSIVKYFFLGFFVAVDTVKPVGESVWNACKDCFSSVFSLIDMVQGEPSGRKTRKGPRGVYFGLRRRRPGRTRQPVATRRGEKENDSSDEGSSDSNSNGGSENDWDDNAGNAEVDIDASLADEEEAIWKAITLRRAWMYVVHVVLTRLGLTMYPIGQLNNELRKKSSLLVDLQASIRQAGVYISDEVDLSEHQTRVIGEAVRATLNHDVDNPSNPSGVSFWEWMMGLFSNADSDMPKDSPLALINSRPLLPVPLQRTKLMEFLGNVTFVAFVDDDIVCESRTVTEEVFLFSDSSGNTNKSPMNPAVHDELSYPGQTGNTSTSGIRANFDPLSIDQGKVAVARHNVVLDLHNTSTMSRSHVRRNSVVSDDDSSSEDYDAHLTGKRRGRFEDPMWWRYLPVLKTIGLSAMMTYSPFTANVKNITDRSTSDGSNQSQPRAISAPSRSKVSAAVETILHWDTPSNGSVKPLSSKEDVEIGLSNLRIELPDLHQPLRRTPRSSHRSHHHHHHHHRSHTSHGQMRAATLSKSVSNNSGSFIENSLVAHVKRVMESENLRDLAEEIGFVPEDIRDLYTRLLEINILSPQLSLVTALEDTHAWGPEDARRRGTLPIQARGVVMLANPPSSAPSATPDQPNFLQNKGTLQLMTQGHPALILNYCKEYWDGNNIVPMTDEDRDSIRNMFDRWSLEDFDVTAFSYCPIPLSHRQLILNTCSSLCSNLEIDQNDRKNDQYVGTGGVNLSDEKEIAPASTMGSIVSELATVKLTTALPRLTTDCSLLSDALNSPHSLRSGDDLFLDKELKTGKEVGESTGVTIGTDDDHKQENVSGVYPIQSAAPTLLYEAPLMTPPPIFTQMRSTSRQVKMDFDMTLAQPAPTSLYFVDPFSREIDDVIVKKQLASVHSLSGTGRPNSRNSNPNISSLFPKLAEQSVVTPVETDPIVPSVEVTEPEPVKDLGDYSIHYAERDEHPPRVESEASNLHEIAIKSDTNDYFENENWLEVVDGEVKLETEIANGFLEANAVADFNDELDGKQPDGDGYESGDSAATEVIPIEIEDKSDLLASPKSSMKSRKSLSSRSSKKTLSFSPVADKKDDEERGLSVRFTDQVRRSTKSYKTKSSKRILRTNSADKLESLGTPDTTPTSDPAGDFLIPITPTTSMSELRKAKSTKSMSKSKSFTASTTPLSLRSVSKRGTFLESKSTQNTPISSARWAALLSNANAVRRVLASSLWPILKQQIFLGMAASSIAVRHDVPKLRENLTSSGIRFVYFSPRNMRRSKPFAHKLGIEFDWNCAISLRPLEVNSVPRSTNDLTAASEGNPNPEESVASDPFRAISSYADWVVHARMPYGVDEIRSHLINVDNVPLLVNLYTDATPATVASIMDIFKEYGEVVLSVGSSYRAGNNKIFGCSRVAVAVAMLPTSSDMKSTLRSDVTAASSGSMNTGAHLDDVPSSEEVVLQHFPTFSECTLCHGDMQLIFALTSIGSVHFLQKPLNAEDHLRKLCSSSSVTSDNLHTPIRLRNLLTNVRSGRIHLLNVYQIISVATISCGALALFSVVEQLFPLTIPVIIPPFMLPMFTCVYLPILLCSMLFNPAPADIMMSTPRKNMLIYKHNDEKRFLKYFVSRCAVQLFSVYAVIYVMSASLYSTHDFSNGLTALHREIMVSKTRSQIYRVLQDITCTQLLLGILIQASTMLNRRQGLLDFPLLRPIKYRIFLLISAFLLGIQVFIVAVRHWLWGDSAELFTDIHYIAWLVVIAVNCVGVLVGVWCNSYDYHFYQRFQQFLRLEFDTKLGMHSPR